MVSMVKLWLSDLNLQLFDVAVSLAFTCISIIQTEKRKQEQERKSAYQKRLFGDLETIAVEGWSAADN